ncbi:glutaredoxin [Dictyocaulus viviparus]|uniref:Prostaglandin E synthase 2 n=1 Tax=Dictyocaulus viviparus TaxID=29172 RepID=A0A0D8XBC2_DICVI|nr:glutaredoxin [Dictyocaulus viviparus]
MRVMKHVAVAAAAYVGLSSISDHADVRAKKLSGERVNGGISRMVLNAHDKTELNLRLYQYQSCPFSCKVRAFLDYYGFSYEVVEVNPITKSQLGFSKDYRKVPIITSGELVLKDSSLIISKLATFLRRSDLSLHDVENLYPVLEFERNKKMVVDCPLKYYVMNRSVSEQRTEEVREERVWRQWVDNHFIHLISPNVYRTPKEALETFKWFSEFGKWEENFTAWNVTLAKYLGAFIMYIVAKRLKAKHKITDERKALFDAFTEWMDAIGPERRFLGGEEPNLADLAMYGAMVAFSGCSAFKEVAASAPIMRWYTAMHLAVGAHQGRYVIEDKSKLAVDTPPQ